MPSMIEDLCEKLCVVLMKSGRLRRRPDMAPWMRNIKRTLKRENGKAVIEWVIENIQNRYCPLVFSPASLEKKFDRIEKLWKRQAIVGVMDSRLEAVMEAVEHLNWPVSNVELAASINRSLGNMRAMRKRIRAMSSSLAVDYLMGEITPVDSAALHWYLAIWQRIQGWAEFSGELAPFEFDLSNRHTQQTIRRWTSKILSGDSLDTFLDGLHED